MSKMFQVYGIGQALIPVLPPPLAFENAPNSNQTNYEIGQVVYTPPRAPNAFYIYAGSGNWMQFGGFNRGVSAAMVAGAVTVLNRSVKTTSSILCYPQTLGTVTVPAAYYISNIVEGVSFTITSSAATDTSTWNYTIIN